MKKDSEQSIRNFKKSSALLYQTLDILEDAMVSLPHNEENKEKIQHINKTIFELGKKIVAASKDIDNVIDMIKDIK